MLGVQLPNFVDQYVKRVDAHLKEVQANFADYQRIADRLHHGSVERLILQHENSPDPTFRSEAEPIRKIHARKLRFEAEKTALAGSFWSRAAHVVFKGDHEILDETYANYSFNLPLNANAVVCGLGLGAIAGFSLEMLLLMIRKLARSYKKSRAKQLTDA